MRGLRRVQQQQLQARQQRQAVAFLANTIKFFFILANSDQQS